MTEKAEFTVVNEHFEVVFNAGLPTQVVFQQPVSLELRFRAPKHNASARRAGAGCGSRSRFPSERYGCRSARFPNEPRHWSSTARRAGLRVGVPTRATPAR